MLRFHHIAVLGITLLGMAIAQPIPKLENVRAVSPPPVPEPLQAGLLLLQQQKFAAAAKALDEAMTQLPKESAYYSQGAFYTGQAYFLAADNPRAIRWLGVAIEAGFQEQEAAFMLGNASIQNREPDRARAAFARLFQVPVDSASAHLLTAQMMVRQEFEEFAEKELKEALRIEPKLPEAHYLLGILATFRNRIDDAVTELRAEIAINPNFAMAYYKLGDAYTRREEWDAALPLLQRSIWLNPNYSGPYILLGKLYFKREDWTNAEGVLRRAIQMDPQNYSARYVLGQTLNKLGRAEEGKQMLLQSQQLRKAANE